MINEEEFTTPGEELFEEDSKPSKTYVDFVKALATIDVTSSKSIENKIVGILSDVNPEVANKLVDSAKTISSEVSQKVSECSSLTESKDGAKKSIKELIGEIFPSLSFYPALGIWSMVDKMISSGKGFEALTPEQSRLLPVYMALFFGLVGGKIAYNRLKERISTNDNIDNEINETLRLAGIQLDEDKEEPEEDEIPDDVHELTSSIYNENYELTESVSSNLDDACNFVSSELANKFGKPIPETEEEKSYADELINMATMKYNVPEDSLKDKLGIIEEPKLEQETEEEVPGEKIEEV